MDKTGVPKEAQDDALSDDITGGRKTPTGRPTRSNVAPMRYFFFFSFCRLGRSGDIEFFLECRTSGKAVIPSICQANALRSQDSHGADVRRESVECR